MARQNPEQNNLYYLLPLLLLATGKDMEQKLNRLSTLLQTTQESVQIIRTGLQTFKTNMAPPNK